jgi:hypothetical protein
MPNDPIDSGQPQDSGAGGGTNDSGTNDAGTDAGFDAGFPAAAHLPLPQLTNRNDGGVLTSPKIYLVFFPGDPNEAAVESFTQKMVQFPGAYWTTTTAEYGVGPLAYGGKIELTGQTAPAMTSQAEIQVFMGQQISAGTFGTPDPQAIYTIFYPPQTVITQPNPVSAFFGTVKSCDKFLGYHNNIALALTDGGPSVDFAYAVLPTCTADVEDLTDTLSHEWVEAATDPALTSNGLFSASGGPRSAYFTVDDDHLLWAALGGGEAGDLCIQEGPAIGITPPDIGHRVQRSWSNASAAAGHDPCVPLTSAPYFNSVPVLTETVTLNSALVGMYTTKGIKIAINQTKTIEVDLFSDAPTGGPWTVKAEDLLVRQFGLNQTLAFAWDKTSGQNGDKLQLSITVTGASPITGAHGFVITSTKGSKIAVWPGLIIDN